MNFDQFTVKCREAVSTAQQTAAKFHHQELTDFTCCMVFCPRRMALRPPSLAGWVLT